MVVSVGFGFFGVIFFVCLQYCLNGFEGMKIQCMDQLNSFLGNKCIVFVIYGFIGNVLVVSVVIDDNVFVGVGVVWNFEDYVVRLSVEESVSFYVEFDLKGLFLCLYVSKYYGVFYGDGGSWYVG